MKYALTIASEGASPVPEEIRLRHLLKRLLRELHFRCERIALAEEPEGRGDTDAGEVRQ